MCAIVLIGTLDTKGNEYARLRELIEELSAEVMLIDAGTHDGGALGADFRSEEVARAGGSDIAAIRAAGDRGAAVAAMARGAAVLATRLHREGRLDGVAALGGSGGTTIATAAMRALPFGVPKLMVSTQASGNVGPYVGSSDIVMFHPVVDVAGANMVMERVLRSAAGAIVGMVRASAVPPTPTGRPVAAATMFGVTTPCVTAARQQLEQAGYEVLTFHATGVGGDAMEELIGGRMIDAVLDLTTTELADELVGGIHPAGSERLRTAGRFGVPQIVSVGALDMVNFGPPDAVPEKLRGRRQLRHNSNVTLVRTNREECGELGRRIAERVNASCGPVAVYLPLRGVSALSSPGGPFHDPDADAALFDALRANCANHVPVIELDCAINDPPFAASVAEALLTYTAPPRPERAAACMPCPTAGARALGTATPSQSRTRSAPP